VSGICKSYQQFLILTGLKISTLKPIGILSRNPAQEPTEDKLKSVVGSFLVDPVVSMARCAFEERNKITMIGMCLDGVEKKYLGT
jgi:hypothetical protein